MSLDNMSPSINSSIQHEQQVWADADVLEFYQAHRAGPTDLYDSERFFLPQVLPHVSSVLDFGCAAGNFSQIMKRFNPRVKYSGVDIIPQFVQTAKQTYPDCNFELGDGLNFSTPPGSFDLVFSSGVLHLNSHHQDIVRALYLQARRYLLCDFRLTHGVTVVGKFRAEFSVTKSVKTELPYFVLNVKDLVKSLEVLTPQPKRIEAYGYYHSPSSMAMVPLPQIITAFFLIEKGEEGQPTSIVLSLPD